MSTRSQPLLYSITLQYGVGTKSRPGIYNQILVTLGSSWRDVWTKDNRARPARAGRAHRSQSRPTAASGSSSNFVLPPPVLAAPRSRLALRLLRRAPVAAALPFSACPTTPRTPHWPLAPSTPLSTSSCPPSPSLPPLPLASRRRPRVPCAAPPLSLFPPARRRSALPLRLLPLQLRRCHPLVRLAALPSPPPPPPPAPPLPASAVSSGAPSVLSVCLPPCLLPP